MKIDVFNHIITPKYVEAVERVTTSGHIFREAAARTPAEFDVEQRLQIMDRYPDYVQVLTAGMYYFVTYSDKAAQLARIVNDELAEVVAKYPKRFLAGVACVPMNDIEAALVEADRAITKLGLRGVELWISRDGKPIDTPDYMPLYEKMAQYDLPILLHPYGGDNTGHYHGEDKSKYGIHSMFGWPYETTVAMSRLVYSGVLEKYPNIKILTHHCGAMVSFFAGRIRLGGAESGLSKEPIDYFRMFYNDTSLHGYPAALMCANSFFGADHILFGTDMPMGRPKQIGGTVPETIEAIEQMTIPASDKKKIFEDNARKLFHLSV